MRIWSLHPKYLDTKGLVALWRETLLAKKVLEGKTKGYLNHPQLTRFKTAKNPIAAINLYLETVWLEAKRRNFNFNEKKFERIEDVEQIKVSTEQLKYEMRHLLNKLKCRAVKKYDEIKYLVDFETHPLFNLISGEIEAWERI